MSDTRRMKAWWALLAVGVAGGLAAAAEPPAKGNVEARVKAMLARQFGTSVQPLSDRKPYYLTGDFNGDGRQDVLVLVQSRGSAAAGVTSLNPWHPRASRLPAVGSTGLAILHGSRGGWDAAAPAARFLVTDREFFSTPIWQAPGGSALLSVKKKPRRGTVTPKGARGDVIHVATEAGIDLSLYWDGKTYRIFAPQEEP